MCMRNYTVGSNTSHLEECCSSRMATSTASRKEQAVGNWASIFPTEQVTQLQSGLFVKKLLAVALSNITYLRTIFPEHAFGDRCLEDLNLKILRDDSACPGACQVIQWVKGCFDALDKKYLRLIVVGLYLDSSDPTTVVETYTFKFSYSDGEGVTIFRNSREIASAYTAAETRKATIKLLRTIVVLTQTLKPLPDDVMMTMKLMYYDDVTPPDYEPPGFQAASGEEEGLADSTMNIRVGDVLTPFHCVKLRIRTQCQQLVPVNDVAVETAKTFENEAAVGSSEEATVPQESGSHGNSPIVRCPCGCYEDDGLMVLCGGCGMWQHAVCFGLLSEGAVPQLHTCEQCPPCTDPSLSSLSPTHLQALCLWRRALLASGEGVKLVVAFFARRLGVTVTVATGLLKRLEREGFIKPAPGAGRGRRPATKVAVKSKAQTEAMLKYFERQKPTEVEAMTEQASALSITLRNEDTELPCSEGAEPAILSAVPQLETGGVRRSPRLVAKRVRSLGDEGAEFELGSQADEGAGPRSKRRKTSIASRSILV